MTATGFDIGWRQSYLYLRVFEDGRAEGQVLRRPSRFEAEAQDVAGKLSPETNARIVRLLDQVELRDLRPSYHSGTFIEAGTDWTVAWRRQGAIREASFIVSFDLGRGGPRRYSDKLVDFQCVVASAKSELTGLPPDLRRCRPPSQR